ncbi:MAG TPA: cellulase family glycosylhydrolase [Verrucomicrobiota bacterium]|nr:cellulase family glycosylhydrolase [Verrucomicrobiota bacterium]HNU50676.1 cellulase family glycosylhydrolase [Verrucomicrobiota bacterium]
MRAIFGTMVLTAGVAAAADLPRAVIPEGVGVNIHFTRGHTNDLDLIAAAGIRCVRMDLGWSGIERQRGVYDWSAYDELTDNLDRRGLRALYILDYSNGLYEETVATRNPVTGQEHRDVASPQHPESVEAFARWAAAAAARYRGRRVLWEIWNEPNITFWKPKPDVRQYNTLALATCRAIRAADPAATIIGPATSEIPMAFLEEHFASGILAYLDAVSVHPYRNYSKPPESAADEYRPLRALIDRHAPRGRKLPILSGEWGYASHNRGVSLDTQAAFAARQQLANLLHGVPLSIWYDWKNDGTDPAEREHNFGLVYPNLDPKPAYESLRTLTTELAGYRVFERLATGSAEDYAVVFRKRGAPLKLALWTTGQPHAIEIPIRSKSEVSIQAVNRVNRNEVNQSGSAMKVALQIAAVGANPPQTLTLDRRRLGVDLGPEPLYLTLTGITLAEPRRP